MKKALCLLFALIILFPSIAIARTKEEITLLNAIADLLISQSEQGDTTNIDTVYYDKERDMLVFSLKIDTISSYDYQNADDKDVQGIKAAIDDCAKLLIEMVKEFGVEVDVFVRLIANDSVFLVGQKNLEPVELDLSQVTNTDAQKKTATLQLFAAYLPILSYSNTDNVKWDISYATDLDAIVLKATYNISSKTWKAAEITKPEVVKNEKEELKEFLIPGTKEIQAELKDAGFPEVDVIMIVKTKDDYQIIKLVNGEEE